MSPKTRERLMSVKAWLCLRDMPRWLALATLALGLLLGSL